ncbi:TIGR03088 family PEP-CTERM/XrtA system glycosyltransferase [Chitinimonas sp.]|uniref:TIGR03088 family PEP-CTERM/XrtA system glycosyltransferase n=1 Tax=Chitinimonas sp. TaxID=1934313 RepID=UPI002F94CB9E
MSAATDTRPLIAHVVYRFDVGGLENGVVNLINRMPADAYRHAVISLTDITDFKHRITRDDVEFFALNKPPGNAVRIYPQLYRLFRQLRPAVVHSRNLAALEVTIPAWLAGVPARIHGEHGRDVSDLDGSSRKYQLVRRLYRPFVSQYVALSQDLAGYLQHKVGVPSSSISQIYNGVDATKFSPAQPRSQITGCPFGEPHHRLFGTVGRMQTVKDQLTLAKAFVEVLSVHPALRDSLRLVMIGDGPLRAQAMTVLEAGGVAELSWLPGERSDVADILRGLDCFVLPSLAEGVSNTILEAMASGLPVIATRVGGNAELMIEGESGLLVPSADVPAMAQAILHYAQHPELAHRAGEVGRAEVERRFSLDAMVATYQRLYDRFSSPRVAGDYRPRELGKADRLASK